VASHEDTNNPHDEGIVHDQILKEQVDSLNREIEILKGNIAHHEESIDPEAEDVIHNRIYRAQVDTLIAGLLFTLGVNGLLRLR